MRETATSARQHEFSRREFIRQCAAGAAVAGISGCARGMDASTAQFPSDPETQNGLVSAAAVDAVMDGLAMALARLDSASLAWQALFNIPGDPSTLRAAIKVNEVGPNKPRAAIVAKVCRALIDCGVQPGNICVYAGNDALGESDPYGGVLRNTVPAGIVVGERTALLGGLVVSTNIPPASKDATTVTSVRCLQAIAERQIDLLVNIAVNKGHWDEFGGCTLTMKNHFGTFDPQPYGGGSFAQTHANFDYLLAINQSEALIGGEIPLQRLCIVDSIWAGSEPNPGAPGDALPSNRIVMGTFSPVVDFLTMKSIRHETMGCPFGTLFEEGLWQLGFPQPTTAALACIDVDADEPQEAVMSEDVTSDTSHLIHPAVSDLRVAQCHDERMVL